MNQRNYILEIPIDIIDIPFFKIKIDQLYFKKSLCITTYFVPLGDESTVTFTLDGLYSPEATSIFCFLKRVSSVLSYSLRQLTQNLFFINADRNVSVDSQRGQFVKLGFVSTLKNIGLEVC